LNDWGCPYKIFKASRFPNFQAVRHASQVLTEVNPQIKASNNYIESLSENGVQVPSRLCFIIPVPQKPMNTLAMTAARDYTVNHYERVK
jgi:hypothetical protein